MMLNPITARLRPNKIHKATDTHIPGVKNTRRRYSEIADTIWNELLRKSFLLPAG